MNSEKPAAHPAGWSSRALVLALGTVLAVTGPSAAQEPVRPVTLEEALREAAQANAHLPVAAANTAIAEQVLLAAKGRRRPQLFVDGDVHDGYPARYGSGDARAQLIAADTLWAGGSVRAGIRAAQWGVRATQAGYRAAVRDVEREVRLRFGEGVLAEREAQIRESGIARLRDYVTFLQAQRAGGQGVAADLLRAEARAAAEEANIADAERRQSAARVELNGLMGRDPLAPLTLAPPDTLLPPTAPADSPWVAAPDVAQALAGSAAAEASIALTRAEGRPSLWISANVGAQPAFGPQGGVLNNGVGRGMEALIGFTVPLYNGGISRAHLAEAQLRARQASDSLLVVRREAHMQWARAVEELNSLYRVVQLRTRGVPLARDAYLQAEAAYRGGAGSALEVIDAFSAWIDAQVTLAQAIADYRQSEANLIRWGGS